MIVDEKMLKVMIPSDDVRKYAIETGFVFSDWLIAALLYHSNMKIKERELYYSRLIRETDDAKLKGQLEKYLKCEKHQIKSF